MDINFGSHIFRNVEIPVLWGTRAILTDKHGSISVIDLSGQKPTLEILGEQPAPKVKFSVADGGVEILGKNGPLYRFDASNRLISSIALRLPDIQIERNQIRVGGSMFSNNMVTGFGVGLLVNEDGMAIGAPLPPELAKLRF